MTKNPKKQKALAEIARLAESHGLEADEIAAYLAKGTPKTAVGPSSITVRLLSYLGGILVFAGLGTYVSLVWDDLTSFLRVLITLGPGLIAFILGLATLKDPRYLRAATPLFIMAGVLEPTGLFVFLNEYFSGDNPALASMVVFGPLSLQMGLVFWKTGRTTLLFSGIWYVFAFFWAAMDYLEIGDDYISLVLGLSGVLVTHAISQTRHRALTPFFYFVFAFVFAAGAYAVLKDLKPFDFALIGIAAGMIYASVLAQSRSFLAASVITMLAYIGYYTNEYFANMVGWPIALIVIGFILVGLSAFGVKLGRQIPR